MYGSAPALGVQRLVGVSTATHQGQAPGAKGSERRGPGTVQAPVGPPFKSQSPGSIAPTLAWGLLHELHAGHLLAGPPH